MNDSTLKLLESGLLHYQAGRLQQAKDIFQDILTSNPQHPEALNLLGIIALRQGKVKMR